MAVRKNVEKLDVGGSAISQGKQACR